METVVSFELPHISLSDTYDIKNIKIKEFKIKGFEKKKKELNKARALLDEPYKNNKKKYQQITNLFSKEGPIKEFIHEKYNTPNVSNAWLKEYEILSKYKVFPNVAETCEYMDNASHPGSWILGAYHYVNTMCDIKNFKWCASSLVTESDENKNPLDDTYFLNRNYPDNYLMSDTNNGDVTILNNQIDFFKRKGGTIDVYTSDLGFSASNNYDKEEEAHLRANVAQILTALLVLKPGGSSITKQFTFMTSLLISVMGILTTLFDKVDICKPMFSRPGNSETYLVCIGYHGFNPENKSSVQYLLLDKIKNWSTTPLITKKNLGSKFINMIQNAQNYFADTQITHLENVISEYNLLKNKNIKYITSYNRFSKQNEIDQKRWLKINVIRSLPNNKRLNVREVMYRENNKSNHYRQRLPMN